MTFFSQGAWCHIYRLCNEIIEAGRYDNMDLLKTREYHDLDESFCKEMLKIAIMVFWNWHGAFLGQMA